MIRNTIITPQLPFSRSNVDFYPLLKWSKNFRKEGWTFNYTRNFLKLKNHKADNLWIDFRYIQRKFPARGDLQNEREEIIHQIEKIKPNVGKVILFDSLDQSGSKAFWLAPFVDIFAKKQLLRDTSLYLSKTAGDSYQVWIPDSIKSPIENHKCLEKKELSKLKLAWNIGMKDYRSFKLKKYMPIGFNKILNSYYPIPKFISPKVKREYLVSFRGALTSSSAYSFQRNSVIGQLEDLSKSTNNKIITGEKVGYSRYLEELLKTKAAVSPNGWGEICYRDFEATIMGAILLKPSMEHLSTWPNFYLKDQTYIDIDWDMSNLKSRLRFVEENYSELTHLVYNSQEVLRESHLSFNNFFSHVKKMLD